MFLTKVDAEKHLEDFSYAYSHDAYVSEKMLERNYALLDFFKDLKQYFEIDNEQKQTNS